MTAIQVKAIVPGSVEGKTTLQLFLCHGLILTVALIFKTSALPVLGACLLSFLLMLNIPYNLHLLEIMLDRLAQGLPVEPAMALDTPLHTRQYDWPADRATRTDAAEQ